MILRKEGKKKKFQQTSQFVHIIHQNSDMEVIAGEFRRKS
jgi:hypothetical protein